VVADIGQASSPSPHRIGGLSIEGEEILRALVPVIVGPLLPDEREARERALEDGMVVLDDYLAHLSLPVQQQARLLLALLYMLPARLLLLRTWHRWCEVDPSHIEAFLLRARTSRIFLLRRIYDFLQSMTVIAWFDQPAAWGDIGYPGPPIERDAKTGTAW